MELKHITHMNAGDGDTSYANNSSLQKVVISKTWPVLDETIKDMSKNGFPKRVIRIADLGCSSGPNTLFLISHIMDTINKELLKNHNIPASAKLEFEVFLNDLPDNDFNNLFKLLLPGKEKKLGCSSMYGVPGSFYGRLFPTNSLHFAFSSYSLHWLSQIPQELGVSNKENIYITTNSPPNVCAAYAKQFEMDFSRFLRVRSEEIITSGGGRMVMAFVGRSVADPSSRDEAVYLTMLAQTLADMAAQGLVKKDDLYSFNMPYYTPCLEEIEAIIGDEGSFVLDKMEVVRVPWDAHEEYDDDKDFDKNRSGKLVADCVRAFTEPMLASHFGSSVSDDVFDRYAEKMAEHLSKDRSSYFTPIVSLTRK